MVEYTFPSSGITVDVKRVPQRLVGDIAKAFPPPPPPINEIGDGDGNIIREENPADPDYAIALERHRGELGTKILTLALKLGVSFRSTDEEIAAEVAALNDVLRETTGAVIDEPDVKMAYLTRICAADDSEVAALAQQILRFSMPTEAAVQEHVAAFRSDVPAS